MLNKIEEQNDDQFIYDLDEAAKIVWENIPQTLRDKYAFGEIFFILETEFDYLDSIGITIDEDEEMPICSYPVDIDQPKMEKHIVDTAMSNGILLNYDELGNILDAEMIYYDMNGALGDAGEYLN